MTVRYCLEIIELFRVEKVGLPAFLNELDTILRSFIPYKTNRKIFWRKILHNMRLRSSAARAGFFSGLHRITRLAPPTVRNELTILLLNISMVDFDWRKEIAEKGHPVLQKVLRHKNSEADAKAEKAKDIEKDPNKQKYGRYLKNCNSMSIFPRQVNEHGRTKVKL